MNSVTVCPRPASPCNSCRPFCKLSIRAQWIYAHHAVPSVRYPYFLSTSTLYILPKWILWIRCTFSAIIFSCPDYTTNVTLWFNWVQVSNKSYSLIHYCRRGFLSRAATAATCVQRRGVAIFINDEFAKIASRSTNFIARHFDPSGFFGEQ